MLLLFFYGWVFFPHSLINSFLIQPIAKWKRELTKGPYKMTIEEHAERVGEQQILMKSEDPKLEEAKIYRSHSFHDFETVNYLEICFYS